MPKIGPKELERRAMREGAAKPRKEVVPHNAKRETAPEARGRHSKRRDNATPPATVTAPGASRAKRSFLAPPGECDYCDRQRDATRLRVQLHRDKARKAKESKP